MKRTAWLQRVHAALSHHGVPRPGRLTAGDAQERLAELDLPPAARRQVDVALAMVEQINAHVGLARPRASLLRPPPAGLPRSHGASHDRYLDERAIVITTNFPEPELAEQVTPRVTSRLLEICGQPISFSGPDYRRVEVLGLEWGRGRRSRPCSPAGDS